MSVFNENNVLPRSMATTLGSGTVTKYVQLTARKNNEQCSYTEARITSSTPKGTD
jgi:hypothetical protein